MGCKHSTNRGELLTDGWQNGGVVKKTKFVRAFKFRVEGQLHEVQLGHGQGCWDVYLDGSFIDRQTHNSNVFKEEIYRIEFQVPSKRGLPLEACVRMEWMIKAKEWDYQFYCNHISVPAAWKRKAGTDRHLGIEAPEIVDTVVTVGPARGDIVL